METKFEQTVYLFKKFNPSKRFNSFSFEELNRFEDITNAFCFEDEIVKVDDDYYKYAGEMKNHWNEQKEAIIRFKNRAKTIKEVAV